MYSSSTAFLCGNYISSSCCDLRLQPCLAPSSTGVRSKRCRSARSSFRYAPAMLSPFYGYGRTREVLRRVTETQTEPDSNNDEDKEGNEDEQAQHSTDSSAQEDNHVDPKPLATERIDDIVAETNSQEVENVEVTSGSPLPGVKPQQLDGSIGIPKETIEILKTQVFGFDTFFVTSQEPYEVGVLFKGNLRGEPAKSFEKITRRMESWVAVVVNVVGGLRQRWAAGDVRQEDFFSGVLLEGRNSTVVPRKILQPDTTAVPEWFAAGAFGLVTVFTLLLRNVPALQSNLLSTFDNLDLLKNGAPGALVMALILGVHELSHIVVANSSGVKLGVPYFVPSWQIGSFGAITRILNIVPRREDLLKVAAAGPLAGFSLGLVLLLLGFFLPPADGIGVIVDSSVFHESFLAGGIAKLLLGDVLKEGTPLSVNPLVIWAWAGLLINAINSIPAGELDGGRIAFAIWGRKASVRFTAAGIGLLGLSAIFNDVAFYWVVLIFVLQRGPIAPLSEEITDPDDKYVALGILVLFLGLLVCLPYPFPFTEEVVTTF